MPEKMVYSNKVNEIVIDGKAARGVKRVQTPRELGYQHEDDLQGGGVTEVTSAERILRLDVGVNARGSDFDWQNVVDSEITLYMQNGEVWTYKNCYIQTGGEPDFGGTGAAIRSVEIIVGDRTVTRV